MRKLPLRIWLVLSAAAITGCASDGWSDGPMGLSADCPASAGSYHEREGMPALRPGDCRPAPAMKVPIRGDGRH